MTSVVGIMVLYMLIRWLFKSAEQPAPPAISVIKLPIVSPPPRRPSPPSVLPPAVAAPSPPAYLAAPPTILSPPILSPPILSPQPHRAAPVVQWTNDQELIAWRVWRLGFLLLRHGGDGGPRLLSFTAQCIWNGPVVHAGDRLLTPEKPTGIYALKLELANHFNWHNEHCWVIGKIALSGRVIEHARGYRAERAVVRWLRVGVGAHLALRSPRQSRELITALEDRYQVSVDAGPRERESADRMLRDGHKAQYSQLPFIWCQPPWRII